MEDTKMSRSGNHVVKYSFQCPNIFVDKLLYFLTGEEWKVLSMAIRHIYGFQDKIVDRTAWLAISFIHEGSFGSKLNHPKGSDAAAFNGSGLPKGAVIKAINNLVRYGILVPVGAPHPHKGQAYRIVEDWEEMDIAGLARRRSAREYRDLLRTKAATTARSRKRDTASTSRVPA